MSLFLKNYFTKKMYESEFNDSDEILYLSGMEKLINKEIDLQKWIDSETYNKIVGRLTKLGESVKSVSRSEKKQPSAMVQNILNVLDKCKQLLDETEITSEKVKFGNVGFRIWLTNVFKSKEELFKEITDNNDALNYFCQSFGSWTRIDYGTGHELNFLAFITALFELNILKEDDCQSVVLDVFWKYWDLTLLIQVKYSLEPAGTHGVWGLDDYVFLPFLFGAYQLIDHPLITPQNVVYPEISSKYENENSYCKWIEIIRKVKVGDFETCARCISTLTAVPSFEKIAIGLTKMYKGEVMNKFPVVQHFRFGTIFTLSQ